MTDLREARRVTNMDVGERRRLGSVTEAAAHAGVHDKTIRRWIKNGDLTGYRVGPKFVRVDMDELDEWLRPTPIARAS